eukprot:TRINITY_DN4766_c0_g1_i2.p1 TRINITY_DN4766_c0_g1~~TRINITY_DN4766_c0_g1_i2.p1  ORF type:complete len:300 (-),score=34.98 TRINITY_DN4766_c0_g1_i2:39-938(-)
MKRGREEREEETVPVKKIKIEQKVPSSSSSSHSSSLFDHLPFELQCRIFSLISGFNTPHAYLLVNRTWNLLFPQNASSLNLVKYSERIDDDILLRICMRSPLLEKITLGKRGVHLKVTQKGLAHLSSLSRLKSLNFISCELTRDTLCILAKKLEKVETMNLTWCEITDQCMESVPLFTRLKHLSLQDSPISDNGLVWLEGMHLLSSLNFSFCASITDKGVSHLIRSVKSLKSLNLSGCLEVTDVTLRQIGDNLIKLKVLHLTGCKNISMDGKNYIRSSLPDCKVYSDSNYTPFKRRIFV